MNSKYPRGSEWRKWDLHFHTPSSYDYKDKSLSNVDIINCLSCHEVAAIAITDHHKIDISRIEELQELGLKTNITVFPGIELTTNAGGSESIHIIGIFSEKSDLDTIWAKISGKLDITEGDIRKKGKSNVYVPLDDAAKIIHELGGIVSIHAGRKTNTIENITNALPYKMAQKRDILKFIDIFEVGKPEDEKEYLEKVIPNIEDVKRPAIILCSDNHNINEYAPKSNLWIKADPTFEGLKQILYEPEPQDRVWIGSDIPYQKESYQIIKKIKFINTKDFPEEIKFNQNLCSIIGGRSAGKSALLNYIAHAIDPELVKKELEIEGAGEGEEYHWGNISIDYEVEWQDGFISEHENSNTRKIIYLPQGYLFDRSKDPNEIKKRIEPILFNKFPDFEGKYEKALIKIDNSNEKIEELIKKWFRLSAQIDESREKIKTLGDKESIKKEKKKIEQRIEDYKRKYSLSEEETNQYQDIKNKLGKFKRKIEQFKKDLEDFQLIFGKNEVFQDIKLELEPSLELLPGTLRELLNKELNKNKVEILEKVNQIAQQYKKELIEDIEKFSKNSQKTLEDSKSLLDKYSKKEELEKLMTKFSEYENILKSIKNYEKFISKNDTKLTEIEEQVRQLIQSRKSTIKNLKTAITELKQDNLEIRFDIDYKVTEDSLNKVARKVNMRDNSEIVNNHDFIKDQDFLFREKPDLLLKNIYSGNQKINLRHEKEEIAVDLLTLTETILFVGKMEGDCIGGFSETTMTPGRRALFLLKLILTESYEKYLLLIDQPEDNLDIKSITEEIVPFLKKRKKERQIIMVSHNANFVIGSDSEQIIVANRNGSDSPNRDGRQFNYLTGSIEYTKKKDDSVKDSLKCQGIREHACIILEGGKKAFEKRERKYGFK